MEFSQKMPFNYGWLEIKLDKDAIDYLWKCEKEAQGDYKNVLVGHLEKSLEIKVKDDWWWDNVIVKCLDEWGEKFDHEHTPIPLPGEKELYLNDMWVNYQYQHEFNPYHFHAGLYSFVIWMKIPTDYKEQNKLDMLKSMKEENKKPGTFEFEYIDIFGGIRRHTYFLDPSREGTMLFFPSQLRHCVNPFYKCRKPRISISGNLMTREARQ